MAYHPFVRTTGHDSARDADESAREIRPPAKDACPEKLGRMGKPGTAIAFNFPQFAMGRHRVCSTHATLERDAQRRNIMPVPTAETVIALFPQSQQGEEVVPMLANRGYAQRDVETLGGARASLSSHGGDVIDKLADLGVCEVAQLESMVEAVSHGGLIIAARTPDRQHAEQLEEMMLDHGATQCLHAPDTGWTTA
jgi:hypothetical protein